MHVWPVDNVHNQGSVEQSDSSQLRTGLTYLKMLPILVLTRTSFPIIYSREHMPAAVSLDVRLQGAPLAHMSNSDQNVVREVVTDSQ